METWFIISVVSAIISSLWSLSVKGGLEMFESESYASWYSVVATLVVGLYVYSKIKTLHITKWGIGAGLSAGVASLLLAKSFDISPNPGYSMAVFRMQSVLTTIASYFLYGAPISISKTMGMLVAICGVITLSTAKTGGSAEGFSKTSEKNTSNDKKNKNTAENNAKYEWVILAFFAGIAMTFKDIFTKSGLSRKNPKSLYTLFWGTSLMQGISLLIILFMKSHSLRIETKDPSIKIRNNIWPVASAGIAFALYQYTVIRAIQLSPNAGYVKAIDSMGMAITSIASHYLYGSPLDKQSIIGIMLVLCGVAGMSR